MTALSKGKSYRLEIQLAVPQNLAPVYLAFLLVLPGTDGGKERLVGPASRSPHFAVPIGLKKGSPLKYGELHSQTSSVVVYATVNKAIESRFVDLGRLKMQVTVIGISAC